MSFFFDVWMKNSFVLASDVRIKINGNFPFAHKIEHSPQNSKVNCAVVACGDYLENCTKYFIESCLQGDSLKDIANKFASKWTKRYAGSGEYSAAHLVGFEKIPNTERYVQQMWYWRTWEIDRGFLSKESLEEDLSSFSQPIPANSHIPWKIKELTGKFPGSSLEDQFELVNSFLSLYQPFFTWNGDTEFWRSATYAVGSAINLLWREKSNWTIDEAVLLTTACLEFIAKVSTLLPESSVGLSPNKDFDVIVVTPSKINWISRPELPTENNEKSE